MEERLPVAVHGGDQGNHILQVGLGGDSLLEILGAGAGHSVLVAALWMIRRSSLGVTCRV